MPKHQSERLDLLIALRNGLGETVDYWADLTDGLSIQAVRKLKGNASALPQYKKSSDTP